MSDFTGARVAVIFDNQARPDTTGFYCLRALEKICQATHVLPAKVHTLEPGFDLYLNIDDSLRYLVPARLRPSAFWVIDTHLQLAWDCHKARAYDWVFAAQKNGAAALRSEGLEGASWLPLACDPELHRRHPEVECDRDVVFVGNVFPGPRQELLESMARSFPNHFFGRAFFDEMAALLSTGRILLNRSIRDDVNMRVFEGCAAGRLLLTNDLHENGQEELLRRGKHLITYRSIPEAVDKVRFYLDNEEEREQIAARGAAHAHAEHTYAARMRTILETAGKAGAGEGQAFGLTRTEHPLTSILILAWNQEKYNRMCVESLRRYTRAPYELILIDNASTDGTLEFFRSVPGAQVIANQENLGFAGGFNCGIEAAQGEYVVLLNNDTLLTAGWLETMLDAFGEHPELGVAGAVSNCISGPQLVPNVPYRDETEMQAFALERQRQFGSRVDPVARITGFCMMISRPTLDRVGLLDTRFGVGNFEDDDYCLRTRLEGLQVGIVPGSFVHHYGSVSFRASGEDYKGLLERNQQVFREKWADVIERKGAPDPAQTEPTGTQMPAPATDPGAAQAARREKGQAAFAQAEKCHSEGRIEAAGQAYLTAATCLPQDPAPLERLGALLLEHGAPVEAAEVYERLVELAPASADVAIRLGIAWARAGQHGAALRQLEKTALSHALAPSERALVLAWAGDARLQLDDSMGALAVFDAALELSPAQADLHDGRGRALVGCGRDEEAITSFQEALRAPDADARFHGNLGAALWNTGRKAEALEALQNAIERGCDDAIVAENYTACALELGQAEVAISTLRRTVERWGEAGAGWIRDLEGAV